VTKGKPSGSLRLDLEARGGPSRRRGEQARSRHGCFVDGSGRSVLLTCARPACRDQTAWPGRGPGGRARPRPDDGQAQEEAREQVAPRHWSLWNNPRQATAPATHRPRHGNVGDRGRKPQPSKAGPVPPCFPFPSPSCLPCLRCSQAVQDGSRQHFVDSYHAFLLGRSSASSLSSSSQALLLTVAVHG